MQLHSHALFGLRLASELALPELDRAAPGEADVTIGFASLPERDGAELVAAGEGALLTVPQVGRYLVERGASIRIDPAPGASESNLRLFLLGSAFGVLLHQRGLVPLHANAIGAGGRAFAFAGHSGAGKSTLAAQLHARGAAMLADDVCTVGFDAAGVPVTWPGIARMRLWRDAVEALGRVPGDYPRSFGGRDKYDVPAERDAGIGPVPLGGVYLLGRGEAAAIRPLRGAAAVAALVANTYRGRYLRVVGDPQAHWAACVALAARVPVFAFERPWDLARAADSLDLLETHFREVGLGS